MQHEMVVAMGVRKTLSIVVTLTTIVLHLGTIRTVAGVRPCNKTGLGRCLFPEGFVFGSASAAYQFEGAAKEFGKGPSIWDVFTHTPGKIADNSNGDVAVDQYHRYQEDVMLMKKAGMDAYRFSISWPRILPTGRGPVNKAGAAYYNRLIDALLQQGIEPYVTLYHWDLPQALEESISGWLSADIVEAFAEFARTSFQLFGDRVKYWITFNEPHHIVSGGYITGTLAPGRCSPSRGNCSAGNSLTEPYIVAHNLLNAHAAAVQVYRQSFQAKQKGLIGFIADSPWFEPQTESPENVAAAQRALEFYLGWFFDPIFFGDYPAVMKEFVGPRLPNFTAEQSGLLKGSTDFVGLNQYYSNYAVHNLSSTDDSKTTVTGAGYKNGTLIGEQAASSWLYIVPWGMKKILNWIKERYNNPNIYITENGVDESNNASIPLQEALQDHKRINYYNDYLQSVLVAIRNGTNVKGYFAWSLMDNFEWSSGYTVRFGLYFVDYANNLTRYPKASVGWFQNLLLPK